MKDQILLQVEELEERIAPSVTGAGGSDGHPGDQAPTLGNPCGSANPEANVNLEWSTVPEN